MKKDYIPLRNTDFVGWEQRFATKVAAHAATLGLNAGQVATVVDKIATHQVQFAEAESAKKTARSKVSAMQRGRVSTVRAIRSLVKAIKASPAYNESIGKEMSIIGPEDSGEMTAPVLRIAMSGGIPIIGYRKGRMDGILLQSRRSGETEFTFLAVDTQSPYPDTRPNQVAGTPEAREYMAWYMKGDQQVGEPSAVVVVLVGGR